MSKFAKFYGQLHMRSPKLDICSSSNRPWFAATHFPINVARRVDAFKAYFCSNILLEIHASSEQRYNPSLSGAKF